jgi:hypothetical protein
MDQEKSDTGVSSIEGYDPSSQETDMMIMLKSMAVSRFLTTIISGPVQRAAETRNIAIFPWVPSAELNQSAESV